jgi:hypothetical protein
VTITTPWRDPPVLRHSCNAEEYCRAREQHDPAYESCNLKKCKLGNADLDEPITALPDGFPFD